MSSRDSFVFYRSFYEAAWHLTDNERLELYEGIINYALNHKMSDLPPMPKALFCLIKPQLEANYKKAIKGKLGAEYGKLGGRPSKNKPHDNPSGVSEDNPKQTANANLNVNLNANANVNLGSYSIKSKIQYGTVLHIETMRTGLDIDYLYETFDRWIVDKDKPKDADSAFLAWVKKFTKGKAA